MSEQQNETKQLDPMIEAFFDGTQTENLIDDEQKKAQEEQELKEKQEAEEQAKLEEESRAKAELEEKEKEQQRLEQERKDNEEKPKPWDEGLNDSAKFILDKLSKGEDKDVYELLKNKFGHENLTPEQKAIAYLSEKNPHLDQEDLLFKAAQEYGIGAEPIDEEELTSEQKAELRKQAIERKGLFSEADKYFSDKSTSIEIPLLPNPLDTDEGYKQYKVYQAELEERKKLEEEENLKLQEEDRKLSEQVNATALEIDSLTLEMEIDLDQGKFDLKSDFKLDEAKRKQLAEYALDYTPTKSEVDAFKNQNGEFDMKGYMTSLAEKLFAKPIQKALIKQAIAKDREEFTERELKNSTLRNNENTRGNHEQPFDIYTSAMGV